MPRSILACAALFLACGGSLPASSGNTSVTPGLGPPADGGTAPNGTGQGGAGDGGDSGLPPDGGRADGGGFGSPDGGRDGGPAGDAGPGALAYALTDLGPGVATAIDDRGRVAGQACPNAAGPCEGAVYTPDAGWAPSPVPQGADYVETMGISSSDQLALNAWFTGQGASYRRAYTAQPLQPFPTASQPAQTTFFNALHPLTGHAVGYDEALGGAFVTDGTTVTPIAAQPGKSYENNGPSQATALNLHDQVAGWMRPSPGPGATNDTPAHAFFWDRGVLKDLGAQGACDSLAMGINDAGLVVGVLDVGDGCSQSEVFTWDGQMHVLGCPAGAVSCWAFALDAQGSIVGNALTDALSPERGFLYRDGQFRWLDELVDAKGWTLNYPRGINAAGQIAGWGTLNGATHAFVLTPR